MNVSKYLGVFGINPSVVYLKIPNLSRVRDTGSLFKIVYEDIYHLEIPLEEIEEEFSKKTSYSVGEFDWLPEFLVKSRGFQSLLAHIRHSCSTYTVSEGSWTADGEPSDRSWINFPCSEAQSESDGLFFNSFPYNGSLLWKIIYSELTQVNSYLFRDWMLLLQKELGDYSKEWRLLTRAWGNPFSQEAQDFFRGCWGNWLQSNLKLRIELEALVEKRAEGISTSIRAARIRNYRSMMINIFKDMDKENIPADEIRAALEEVIINGVSRR